MKTRSIAVLLLLGIAFWALGYYWHTFNYVIAIFCWGIATYALADLWKVYVDKKSRKKR